MGYFFVRVFVGFFVVVCGFFCYFFVLFVFCSFVVCLVCTGGGGGVMGFLFG